MSNINDGEFQYLVALALRFYVEASRNASQKEAPSGKKMAGRAKCDVWLADVKDGQGYVLRTREVVTVPAYWEVALRGAGWIARAMSPAAVKQMAPARSSLCSRESPHDREFRIRESH